MKTPPKKNAARKSKVPKYPGFNLVPDTVGKIVDSVWLKDDQSELIIKFAWGPALHFRPLDKFENEN